MNHYDPDNAPALMSAKDDPHFVCSQGARNCADCGAMCSESDPCPCCGGEEQDLELWFARCSRCNESVLTEEGFIVFAPAPGSDLMHGTFVCNECEADA